MFKGINLGALAVVAVLCGSSLAVAGPVSGAAETTETVSAHASNSYTVELNGGKVTQINFIGDGDTDLDLFVYDEYGNLVASSDDVRDFGRVRFTPAFRGKFRIEVKNLGDVYNEFTVRVR